MTTTTAAVAVAGWDEQRARQVLTAALEAPGGVSVSGMLRLIQRDRAPSADHQQVTLTAAAWLYTTLAGQEQAGTVQRTGPDPRINGAHRYRATHPAADVSALVAGALVALAERGWVQGDYTDDDTGRVDLLGALLLAAGHHPRDIPDGQALVVLRDTEDALAVHIGADPAKVDAAERLVRWQDATGRGEHDVYELLHITLTDLTAPGTARR